VQEIFTNEQRALAEHKPPGMAGSLLQNMGRRPTRLTLWGVASGLEAKDFIEKLDQKFRAGDAVTFISDILADAEIEHMLIDDLRLQELAGKPERFAYVLSLREYIEPIEPESSSLLDTDILENAGNLLNDLVDGLDIGLGFATGLDRFISPLSGLLSRLKQFREDVGQAQS